MASNTKALVKFDQELADLASKYSQQEANTGGGNFISIEGGNIEVNGATVPNNELVAIIVDAILVNAYFVGKYQRGKPTTPVCYAMGREEKELAPHAESADPQNDDCAGCDSNQFGSGEGRGKACKNTRRVALISAGNLEKGRFKPFTDTEEFEKGERYYLSVPPTSINGFGAYVKQLAGALKLPPFAVFTKISLVPDTKTMVKLVFQALQPVPKQLLPILIERHKAEREVIEFPWAKKDDEAPARGGRSNAKAARGKAGRKY